MINLLTKSIIDARLNKKLLNDFPDYYLNLNDAYKIQEKINSKLSLNKFGDFIGYKIGCTNKVIQEELNVSEPIYGAIFKNKVLKNHSNIPIKNFIKVGVECEIYVIISKNITNLEELSKNKITNLFDYCGLSLDIVEDRFLEIKKNKVEYIIADGALGNSIILGKKTKNKFNDYSKFTGRLFLNNTEIFSSFSDSILGDPLNALMWYFKKKLELNKIIYKGEVISLGSITPLLWVNEPCSIKAKIDELDECTVNFI